MNVIQTGSGLRSLTPLVGASVVGTNPGFGVGSHDPADHSNGGTATRRGIIHPKKRRILLEKTGYLCGYHQSTSDNLSYVYNSVALSSGVRRGHQHRILSDPRQALGPCNWLVVRQCIPGEALAPPKSEHFCGN